MLKRLAIVALLGVALISAKTFTFSIAEPTQAGKVQLKPGQYSLKVEGEQVQLLDKSGRQIDASAKVQTADRKFDQTAVATTKADGASRLESVQLGGSNFKVVFD